MNRTFVLILALLGTFAWLIYSSEQKFTQPAENNVTVDNSRDSSTTIVPPVETVPSGIDNAGIVDDLVNFRHWHRLLKAGSAGPGFEQQGVKLAKDRQQHIKRLIQQDPGKALGLALDYNEYNALPAVVRAYVEEPFSDLVDLLVFPACEPPASCRGQANQFFTIDNNQVELQVYFETARQDIVSKYNVAVQGVKIDGLAAISANPVELVPDSLAEIIRKKYPTIDGYNNGPHLAFFGGALLQLNTPDEVDVLNNYLRLNERRGGPVSGYARVLENISVSGGIFNLSNVILDSTWTETPKTAYFIVLEFPDFPTNTVPGVFGNLLNGDVADQLKQMSYNKTWVNATVHPTVIVMEQPSTYYLDQQDGSYELHSDARALLAQQAPEINLNDYDLSGIDFPFIGLSSGGGFIFGGLATLGGPYVWLQGTSSNQGTIVHEFGHSYGISHANFWDTDGLSSLGLGNSIEYGDPYDVMGDGNVPAGHFGPATKELLEWISIDDWIDVRTEGDGTYRLNRIDHVDATGIRGIRLDMLYDDPQAVNEGETNYLWLGYRQNYPDTESLHKGLYLTWHKEFSIRTNLIDTTPGSAGGKADAGLLLGQTFTEVEDVYITPISRGGESPDEWIDVTILFGDYSWNNAPTGELQLLGQASARTPMSFAAFFDDFDADSLLYSWDLGDGQFVQDSLPVLKKIWSVGGLYNVKVTATDLKGGQLSVDLQIEVSDPLTQLTTVISPTSQTLSAIHSNGSTVLAVGRDTVLSSSGGISWSEIGTPGINVIPDELTWHFDKWIMVGEDYDFDLENWVGIISTSTDGVSWTVRHRGDLPLSDIACSPTLCITIGKQDLVLTSTDGITWVDQGILAGTDWSDLAWGDGTFVLVGGGKVYSSEDGLSWTDQTGGSSYSFQFIHFLNNKFVASDYNVPISHSDNGGASFNNTQSRSLGMESIAYNNSTYFATGQIYDQGWIYVDFVSTDGKTWFEANRDLGTHYRDVAFHQDRLISVGAGGAIRYSSAMPADSDGDGLLDNCDAACVSAGQSADPDDDNDGIPDVTDLFPTIILGSYTDTDNDGAPDDCILACLSSGMAADPDDDNDGIADSADGFPVLSIGSLADLDRDGIPDDCNATCLSLGFMADEDDDGDGIPDENDVFPSIHISNLLDTDGDGAPDSCNTECVARGMAADSDDDGDGINDDIDPFPLVSSVGYDDLDGDGAPDECDAACLAAGLQADDDDDGDGLPDVEDGFPTIDIRPYTDTDGDGIPDTCVGACAETGMTADNDDDNDGIPDENDAYPLINLGTALDTDGDGAPNVCGVSCRLSGMDQDTDDDADGIEDINDVYPLISIADFDDLDGDGAPDDCEAQCLDTGMLADDDDDGDGISDEVDGFPRIALGEYLDTDNDGTPDTCDDTCLLTGMTADADDDNDAIPDADDAFPLVDIGTNTDTDGDGAPDVCGISCRLSGMEQDTDDDADGILDSLDTYPLVSITGFTDLDGDGAPDECDPNCLATGMQADTDDDGDGVEDVADGFPLINIGGYLDSDNDGLPNSCEDSCLLTGMTADNDDDGDSILDENDAFPLINIGELTDTDADGAPNDCGITCRSTTGMEADTDDDGDGIEDNLDIYPLVSITGFADLDGDGAPNECIDICLATGMQADVDDDGDAIPDISDGFPLIAIDGYLDSDNDGRPNECDDICLLTGMTADNDDDGDTILDENDAFPLINIGELTDTDADGAPNDCGITCRSTTGMEADTDDDGDGIEDNLDTYPLISITGFDDLDGDGIPDTCEETCLLTGMLSDPDDDNDGLEDDEDAYPSIPIGDLLDTDGDGAPNDCDEDCELSGMIADADDDNDGVADVDDTFPLNSLEYVDSDNDGLGDAADLDDDNDLLPDELELLIGTSLINPDSDDDNLRDDYEYELGLNPLLDQRHSLDLDGDGSARPLSDGIILIRLLFDFESASITGLQTVGATLDEAQIKDRLNTIRDSFNVDQNPDVTALNDGIIVLRYLFGFKQGVLTENALSEDCGRCDPDEIRTYVEHIR